MGHGGGPCFSECALVTVAMGMEKERNRMTISPLMWVSGSSLWPLGYRDLLPAWGLPAWIFITRSSKTMNAFLLLGLFWTCLELFFIFFPSFLNESLNHCFDSGLCSHINVFTFHLNTILVESHKFTIFYHSFCNIFLFS